jgi:ParB-like chromosome segregation protein Spo0J
MKMQNVPLSDIVPNPWRDMKLYPIKSDEAKEHIRDLRESINDHGFFGGVKGRRVDGKVQIACGHMRIEAARAAKPPLETIPIFIDDMDEDAMLRLMTDENALQAGSNPGAVMNEVAAVTRRLIDGLLSAPTIVGVPRAVKDAFESEYAIKQAIGKLRAGKDIHLALGYETIRRYLGQGEIDRSHRGERQVRTAITALKQSGDYDDVVNEMRAKYPVPDAPSAKSKAAAVPKPRRAPVLDGRCATVFENEHQFDAFREAVTTTTASKVIPVNKQLALAKEIMSAKRGGEFKKKHVGAPFIKAFVHGQVQDAIKAQRTIDKAEREAYLAEQAEARIDSELHSAKASVRSLTSSIARLIDLAGDFPHHPKLGGFSAQLDRLAIAIKQLSEKLK